jgi:hypothetical protein
MTTPRTADEREFIKQMDRLEGPLTDEERVQFIRAAQAFGDL